ncbi:cystathionine beta-synthase [Saitoella complicata NRRL Y-17804]|nr:cystathionine beta-synthase [Saitoella complicata NRRL Y-17804]ODQ53573.1 cystathionine beta-synthase [Saitoella complicata NRRL Y-17804]
MANIINEKDCAGPVNANAERYDHRKHTMERPPEPDSAAHSRHPPAAMNNVLEAIGNTPLVRLNRIPQEEGLECEIWAKCEFFNAGGSVKDRIALRMIEEAERSGRLQPGDILIEPTSGNTGIGLALCAAIKGYHTIITLPEKMSAEKVSILRALGAEIIRTPTEAAWDSPESHISVARRIEKELCERAEKLNVGKKVGDEEWVGKGVVLDQYVNVANPAAHEEGTGREILEQIPGGKVDMIVAGAGTGGTITGVATVLKNACPDVKVIGIDPHGSILAEPEDLNDDRQSYQTEGIGYDFIPDVLKRSLVTSWLKSNDADSLTTARRLIRSEGLLVGGSSGAAVWGAIQAAKHHKLGKGDKVVVILADGVRNYLTKFVSEDWMRARGFLGNVESEKEEEKSKAQKNRDEMRLRDLGLKPVVCVKVNDKCEAAVKVMQDHAFDQLPVQNEAGKLVGLVTLGNLLSALTHTRADPSTQISSIMFDFRRLPARTFASFSSTAPERLAKREFQEVTVDTKIKDILDSGFFDFWSAMIVTERDESGAIKPVHTVTKVDLLSYLVEGR